MDNYDLITPKVITVHPEEAMDVCNKFNSN